MRVVTASRVIKAEYRICVVTVSEAKQSLYRGKRHMLYPVSEAKRSLKEAVICFYFGTKKQLDNFMLQN